LNTINYEIDINAPVEKVFEYYTDADNIKKAWPQDIVKESESLSTTKNEEGSEMKVEGEYMGRKEEMIIEVTEKDQNKLLVTEQKEGPFQYWKSTQEFNGDEGNTHVKHEISYELPTTGKVANFLSGDQAENKLKDGLQQAAETVKQELESQ
jgi:ligand-binding SRPBCC domain-containing protein